MGSLHSCTRYKSEYILTVLAILCIMQPAFSQEGIQSGTLSYDGYLRNLPFIKLTPDFNNPDFNNIVHWRLNTRYSPFDWIYIEAQGRMLLYYGRQFEGDTANPIVDLLSEDPGYLDLTNALQTILYGNIDRLRFNITAQKFQFSIGRQRVNWGTNLIWNPNDWFNVFSFLDFDYIERPGTDALAIQYYTGFVDVIELVLEAAKRQQERTFALMYRFNRVQYDFQIQGGLYDLDAAAGVSWSGDIRGGGFRGEIAYFHPFLSDNVDRVIAADTNGTIVGAISVDYTFSNSLYIHTEFLYNGFGTTGPVVQGQTSTKERLSAKQLVASRYALFAQTQYMFTPLVQGTFSGSVNPGDWSFYLSPALNISLRESLDLFLIAQFFIGDHQTLYGDLGSLLSASFTFSY